VTVYFDTAGPTNTEAAVEAALDRLVALGLSDIVVASNTGATARAVLAGLARRTRKPAGARDAAGRGDPAPVDAPGVEGVNLVVVTHHVGFREPGQDEMGQATRAELSAAGARILTTTHLFAGVERAAMRKWSGIYPGGLIANTLRLFGEGTKVAVEIAVMALDAGLVPYGRDILAIGGTGRGADTALVVRPAHANSFFQTRILEFICRPRPTD